MSMPVLRRAFGSAGVPVAVAAEEVPLAVQPAVRPLLTVLGCVVDPDSLGEDQAVELLTSALGGADVIGLRRLRQELRRSELAAGGGRAVRAVARRGASPTRARCSTSSRVRPDRLPGWPSSCRPPPRRMPARAPASRTCSGRSGPPRVCPAGGSGPASRAVPRGAAADRDLDAVVALFETAARFCRPAARRRLRGVPRPPHRVRRSPPTRSRRGRRRATPCRVLTAHASKGLEWDLVCVAGVQEGVWPVVAVARLVPRHRATRRPVAARRRVRCRRGGGGDDAHPTARRGAAAVLRRRDASPAPPARDRGDQRARRASPSRFLDEIDPLPDGRRGRHRAAGHCRRPGR